MRGQKRVEDALAPRASIFLCKKIFTMVDGMPGQGGQ